MKLTEYHIHPVAPLYDGNSRVLILGTFPSPKSREAGFFYGHPQNRFWKVMAAITGNLLPKSIDDKKKLMLDNGMALWDVIKSCRITGASDSSIRDVVPADISIILENSPIERIYANGTMAQKLYDKYLFHNTGRSIIRLPSTSPANAGCSLDDLIEAWSFVLV